MSTPGIHVLPDCRTKVQKNVVRLGNLNWIPIFCANCGADGGMIPEDNHDFAFYLCIPCSEKWGNIDGVYMEPDHVFWERLQAEEMGKYGRILTLDEEVEVLKDGNSTLAKLAREKPDFTQIKNT